MSKKELKAYSNLSKVFRRFSIHKTEMIPEEFTVDAVIYHGMGDFTNYKAEGKTLEEAVNKVFDIYCERIGITRERLNDFLKK